MAAGRRGNRPFGRATLAAASCSHTCVQLRVRGRVILMGRCIDALLARHGYTSAQFETVGVRERRAEAAAKRYAERRAILSRAPERPFLEFAHHPGRRLHTRRRGGAMNRAHRAAACSFVVLGLVVSAHAGQRYEVTVIDRQDNTSEYTYAHP